MKGLSMADDNLMPVKNKDGSIAFIPHSGIMQGMEVADIQTAETPAPFKPALGRIVHVHWKDEGASTIEHVVAPAIITKVHSDNCVNVSVFRDGSNIAGCFSSVTNNPNDSKYWCAPPRV